MRLILLLFGSSIAYAIVRYVAFAPENAGNLPTFILNKAIAMAAALCFVFAFFQQFKQMRGGAVGVEPALLFRIGVFAAVAHIPMSLAIMQPAYFGEFYAEGRLSFAGEMVFLFGGLTAGGVFLLTRSGLAPGTRWRISLATMCALFLHVLSMGICRGMNINASHAYLPPMWLLSLIGIACAVIWLLMSRPGTGRAEKQQSEPSLTPPVDRR